MIDPSGHRPCDNFDKNGQCITEPGWSKGSKPWRPPLDDMSTSGFSFDVDGKDPDHPGQDYGGPDDANIYTSGIGRVIISDPCTATNCYNQSKGKHKFYAPFNQGYGNVVVIEYQYNNLPPSVINQYGLKPDQSLFFLYAHLREPSSLSNGDIVISGDIVGNVGSSGFSDGGHLHLEIRIGKTGSLIQGDMCAETCFSNIFNPTPRFYDWYDSGDYDPLDPTMIFK